MTETSLAVRTEEPALTPFQVIERVIGSGDLSRMEPADRVAFYWRVCESTGLNPLTRPFEFINLNGKLTLYAKKDATDQLRKLHGVTVARLERDRTDDLMVVTAHGTTSDGREDSAIGAVSIKGLAGEALANALMKAETKAKRRLTLSLVGLGFLDESEVEAGSAVDVDPSTGEIREAPKPASLLEAVRSQADRLAAPPPAAPAAEDALFADSEPAADPGPSRDDVEEGHVTEAEGAPDLVAVLRERAAASSLAGGPTDLQKRRLIAAFAGMPHELVQGGVRAVFGHEDGRLRTAAEAQAVITIADSLGDEPFRADWSALA